MSSPPLLQIQQISKRFGNVQALSSISLTFQSGRVYGLAGENGAGKSTLVKILCGVHSDFEGQIYLNGKAYRPHSTSEAENAGISVFHQEMPVCQSLSVAANVFLGPDLPSGGFFPDWSKIEARCEQMFRDLLGIETDAARLMGECTIAERQLALLVRVLSRNARLIILDEPTTALTPTEVAKLFMVIRRLLAQGITFVFVSHLLDELLEISDEIYVLRDGVVAGYHRRGEFDTRSLARLIAGHDVEDRQSEVPNKDRATKLEVRELSLNGVFNDVSFKLFAGEILGITGLQGSGRSAVARALFGAPPAQAGEIFKDGKKLHLRTVADAIGNGIGYVPEDRQTLGLFDDLDVQSNLGVLRLDSMARFGLLSLSHLRELALTMQGKLKIKFPATGARIGSLSGGNQQKILIGRWLSIKPDVLVMNEPTRGVDIGAKDEICRFIRALANEGCSFLVSSSDLDELLRMADRVLVMNSGRLTAEFSRSGLRREDLVHATGATLRSLS
jgi:ABC-type sugar transport system ATPase subunit